MKFKDLTKEQQEHLSDLLADYGLPPNGCTHFDIDDNSSSSYMKLSSTNSWQFWRDGYWSKESVNWTYDNDSSCTPLPEPPYYLPESVALPNQNKPLVIQQAIIQCYLIDTFGCSDREALAHSRLIMKEIT